MWKMGVKARAEIRGHDHEDRHANRLGIDLGDSGRIRDRRTGETRDTWVA
jgi:hypothetical protein